jgi:hypothetical protein
LYTCPRPSRRAARLNALSEFLDWCGMRGVTSVTDVQPMHVGAYIEMLTRSLSAPGARIRLDD